jgi:hypothetical protein
MALAREDRFPITDIMRQTPQIPDNCQWATRAKNDARSARKFTPTVVQLCR